MNKKIIINIFKMLITIVIIVIWFKCLFAAFDVHFFCGVVYLLISFITIGVMAQIEEYNKSKNNE